MKSKMNKTNHSSNLSSVTSKTNGSPNLKENTQVISAKYINLLKPKKESASKQKVLYPNTQALDPTMYTVSSNNTASRGLIEREHNSSFTKNQSRITRDKSTGTNKQTEYMTVSQTKTNSSNINILKCNERDGLFNVPVKNQEPGFRSPPLAHKNFSANLLTTNFHSGGKTILLNNANIIANNNKKKESISITPLSTLNPTPRILNNNSTAKAMASPPKGSDSQTFLTNSNAITISSLMLLASNYKGAYITLEGRQQINMHCLYHSDKKTKFYVKNMLKEQLTGKGKGIPGFCSKCAVNLVKQGIECEEINFEFSEACNCIKKSNGDFCSKCMAKFPKNIKNLSENLTPNEQHRKERIVQFVEELLKHKETCQQTIGILDKKQKEIAVGHENQLEEINGYFTDLYSFLESKRLSTVAQLDQCYKANMGTLGSYISVFTETHKEFEIIYSDIDENYKRIITKIELTPFNNILAKYQEKINGFLRCADQIDSLQLSTTTFKIGKPSERIETAFDPKIQITTRTSPIIENKKIDLDDSNKQNSFTDENERFVQSVTDLPYLSEPQYDSRLASDTFRSKRDDNYSKSDVYISFDQNNSGHRMIDTRTSEDCDFDIDYENAKSTKVTKKFNDILLKINRSQNQHENFYTQFIPSTSNNADFKKTRQETEDLEQSIIESEDRVFAIEPANENDNWEQKQTPDLGEKQSPPDPIASHFRNMVQSNSEYIESGKQSFQTQDANSPGAKLTCQKVLFKEI